ncbi:MAG: AAA domain-containing protein [Planctomycetota bacterium]
MDLRAFAQRHRDLLQQERDAEIAQVQRLLAERSEAELEARGVLLRRLQVADLEPGLGGQTHAVLAPSRGGELPPHRFGPGDVVALDGDGEKPVQGTVARVRRDQITVALDDDEADLPALVRLQRLAPDVTYKRLQQALVDLQRERKADDRRLIDVCFQQREPSFATPGTAGHAAAAAPSLDPALDASQQLAVAHALAAEELALIHGPPGTGKTTAIVEVIRRAIARGDKVLACAPSNVAVDNLAEKLLQHGVRLVRIGQPVRVLPAVVEHSLAVQVQNAAEQRVLRDVRQELQRLQRKLLKAERRQRRELYQEQRRLRAELRQLEGAIVRGLIDTAEVVLATTTGAVDRALEDRTFDLAVVDEAAQAFEAATWLPLLRARRAVLAGDHCQLPPTVTSAAAAQGGLATTLFERLMRGATGAQLGRMLTVQYRMHAAIQAWSAAAFYGGALTPAPAVAAHRLCELPDVTTTESTELPLLFLDTAGCGHEESVGEDDGSKSNDGEAAIAAAHVRHLLDAGVRPGDLAVVTPYTAQVRLLRDRLGGIEGLEIGTVDGLQGREKEAVVLSLVRSNDRGEVGFLAELRRLNVALTRARRHLCVVGDSATLGAHADLGGVVNWLMETGEHRSAWGIE